MGNATMEETTDGEHKMRVGEGALTETVDDAIVKESTDGEHKAQGSEEEADPETVGDVIVEESTNGVREEEGLNETAGDIIVEESTDIEHKAQVREEEAVTETLGYVVVKENTDGEHKAQVGGEKPGTETVGVVIVEESTGSEHKVRVGEEEVISETVGVLIVEESTDSEHKEQVMEEEAVTESDGIVIVEESNGGEHMAQVGKEEAVTETVVEESTDGNHMKQVREEDVLNEMVACVIVKESTDDKHKAQVGEEDMLNVTMVDALVEESTDGKHKTQLREEVAVLDEMGNVIAEETTEGDHKAQVGKGEVVYETMCNVIVEGSTDGEHRAQVGGEAVLNRTMGDVIVKESTGGEPKEDSREEEAVMNETEKQVIESMASETRVIPLIENDQHVQYHLPPLYKTNFSISDLVWGKVKSHPWWPGQIFDPSDATKLAMKYQKKDSFLIGYFGDKTFAWCDESQLKPFHSHFSQLEKQCTSDTFVKAIRDIMTEVSRRVELGMACSCLPEEDYTSIKYQKVENAGIRGGNINSIIDRHTVANCFQPDRLLDYIESLAKFPNGTVDKLEFVIAQSQLKAFYHSKGYPELTAFTVGGGLVESVPESSLSSAQGSMGNIVENCTPVPSDLISAEGKVRIEERSFNKREHGLKDDWKQKSISKLTEDGNAVHLAIGGKSTSLAKAAERPISSSSGKKHIIVESDPADSGRCKKRMLDSFEDLEIKSPSPTVTRSFKIGEFIRRAASQLTGAPPITKCQGETLQKCGPQAEHKKDNISHFDVFLDTAVENQTTDLFFAEDYNSPDEMLSQLCLSAREPMEEHGFVSTIVAFFTGFRNFCVSSSSEDKEHVEKRKRGRPRKVILQQASYDVSSSEDEKHVEKRQRGMLKNVLSQLASSDISSEEEKPVVKRKRGRPRKNPQPASSDSEDKKPVEKCKRGRPMGRPRGRPKKVESQLASPDYSSSENKRPVEKSRRGRPKKVNSEIAPSNICTPDHVKDSCWSDKDLQKTRNSKSHIQYQRKRRKSTGVQSLSLPSAPTPHVEQQLQLVIMDPNIRHTCLAERSIVSVEEKLMDERMPTALVLTFNNANSLPSETDLIRIFSRYGPLKEAETDVLKKTNHAKLVFKRRVDAETAFSSAGKYSIFGPGLLSYQLKPWTPRSASHATPEDTQNTAPAAMEQDNHYAAPIAEPQDNYDVVSITTTVPDNQDASPITTAQDSHDLAHMPMVQDNHDVAAVITLQDKCEAGPSVESNLELSEQAEPVIVPDILQVKAEGKEALPHDKQEPALIATPQENQDAVFVASPQDEHDLSLNSKQYDLDAAPITMVQDNHGATAVIRLQDQCCAGPTTGSNLDISEQVDDVIASGTIQFKEPSSPHDKDDTALIVASQENQDAVPMSLLLEHDSAPTSTQDNMNADNMDSAAPITMVLDNYDAAAVITLQDKCDAGFTVGSNSELSEQAEDVIASEATQIEAKGKGSASNDEHDPSLISAQQQNQDAVHITSPLDEHDLTPTNTQDNLDAAPITMVQDNHGAAAVSTLHKCNAGTAEGCNLELSVSGTIQLAAENEESVPQENLDPALISTQQNEDAVPISSLVDEHGLTPTSTQDNLDAVPITMAQDNHDAAAAMTLQDKCDAGPTVRNLELAEQAEDVTALDAIQVEAAVKESLPEDNRDPSLTATSEQNQDAVHTALMLDKLDSTPSTSEDNIAAAPISMPQDNHGASSDAAPIGTLRHIKDGEPIAPLPEVHHDAAPIGTPQDNRDDVSIAKPLDHRDAAPISTSQDNQDAASIAKPQDMHDSAQIGKAQDCHNLAPTTPVQDNHDATAAISPQEKCDAGQAVGSNLEIPEQMEDVMAEDTRQVANNHVSEQEEDVIASASIQVEAEGQLLLQDNHDPTLIATPHQHQDEGPIALLREKDDSTPSTMQDNLDAAHISMPQGNHDAAPINIQDNKDAASIMSPQDDQDTTPISTSQDNQDVEAINKLPEDNHDAVSITTPSEHEDAAPITTPQDSHDAASIPTPQEKHDLVPINTTHECHDGAPITMVVGNDDAANKCDSGSTVGSNLDLSEQAEDVIVACNMQVDAQDNKSLPQDKQDQAMSATPHQNQDAEPVASLIDKHDSRATITGDNIDAAPRMPEDNHDTPSPTTPQNNDAVFIEACNLEVSEQAESGMASETRQVEPKGGKLEASGQSETGMASDTMQV